MIGFDNKMDVEYEKGVKDNSRAFWPNKVCEWHIIHIDEKLREEQILEKKKITDFELDGLNFISLFTSKNRCQVDLVLRT